MGSFDKQIFQELKSISRKLEPKPILAPYIEKETLSKAAAVSSFGTTLEIAGNEFTQFIIRTDGEIHDISLRVKNLRGGFSDEIELINLDVIPGPVDLIQFKNDNAESGTSIFVSKLRIPEPHPFLSGFGGGRSHVEIFSDSLGPASVNTIAADSISNSRKSVSASSFKYAFYPAAGNWDRWRNNSYTTPFSSASRTQAGGPTFNSSAQTNHNWKGGRFYLDITASSGTTETLDVKIQTIDAIIGTNHDLPGGSFAQATNTTNQVLVIYPGVAETANVSVSDVIGRQFRAVATVGSADSDGDFTFSLVFEGIL